MTKEACLDFDGIDVFAAADKHVLQDTGYLQIADGMQRPQIIRPQPPFVEKLDRNQIRRSS